MSISSPAALSADVYPAEHSARVDRLENLLARRDIKLSEFEKGVECATDLELIPFGLRAYRLNLLSLFGNSWSPDKIFTTARRAAISKILGGWEHHHHYLPGLRGVAEPELTDLPTEIIKSLLAQGRGLIVMSFHLGHMRQIATDLAHSNIPILLPLATDAFNNYQTARRANPNAALWTHLRPVNVEERGGSFALARTLSGGGCVFSTIDGNTGLDGPHGSRRRTTVPLLEATAKVKTGLFDMAARFGAPILIVVAYTERGRRICRTAPVIDCGGPLPDEESKRFVETSVRAAYAFLGATLKEHADEWCGGDLFHQWRLPSSTPPSELSDVESHLATRLADGDSLVVNRRRILSLDDDTNLIWSDAVSGKCFRLPQDMAVAAQRLWAHETGIDLHWLDQNPDVERLRTLTVLYQLAARDAIVVKDRYTHQCNRVT